jgi:V/A-type H+-transporting ATPase subunit I
MAKVRILGPRARLDETLRAIQRVGLVQITDAPAVPGLTPLDLNARDLRRRRQLQRLVEDTQACLEALAVKQGEVDFTPAWTPVSQLATWARLARRIRRSTVRIAADELRLTEERGLIQQYRDLLNVLAPDLRELARVPHVVTHAAVIPASERAAVEALVDAMQSKREQGVAVKAHALRNGDLALLIIMPARAAAGVERVLAEAHVPEVSLPAQFRASSLTEAVPLMLERLSRIPGELESLRREREVLSREHGQELLRARAVGHDIIAQLEAWEHCAATSHAFAVEGWTPKADAKRLDESLKREIGPVIAVEEVAEENWIGEPAPVVLSNPRLLRPFEAIVKFMPLPRYGTIDPTPFVAFFFPLLFGLMLADIGYGLLLGGVGLLLHRRTKPGTRSRAIAEMIGPCALLSIFAGVMFGEFFGDLGRRVFGLRAVAFDRQEAVVASLLLAVGLGFVHVTLGLVLGVVSAWRKSPRHAFGRGVAAIMVLLIVLALLAAFDVLPGALLTPSVIALFVAFPVLVALEGAIAAVELLSTLGNMLSYARVMALGLASVMLAIVANRMAGVVGSTIVGVLLALLFHLVNFGIGVFGPGIHALRLHYVEFFGKFYSPGGVPYHPFAHWRSPPVAGSR